jgi:hypothetical protein
VIRARYLVDAIGLNKIQGQPFKVREVVDAIEGLMQGRASSQGDVVIATA